LITINPKKKKHIIISTKYDIFSIYSNILPQTQDFRIFHFDFEGDVSIYGKYIIFSVYSVLDDIVIFSIYELIVFKY
jgi:hypothetical protein